MGLIILTIALHCMLISFASTQSDNGESCNVVCNCNTGQPGAGNPSIRSSTAQGSPGKLGPRGDIGPVGEPGQKGNAGLKGEKGRAGNDISLSQVLSAMSVMSCLDLKTRYQINSSGYYLLMDPHTRTPVYQYCDFIRYTDATTCSELLEKHNITRKGNYILGRNSESFQFCEQPTFVGIYTCQELRNRYASVTESGFYSFKSPGSETFKVYCNFSQNPVATEVRHDLMEEHRIQSTCESNGCFTASPAYEVEASSLLKIVENSVSCRQYIKLRCQGVLFNWQGQFTRGWWVSRDGVKMRYWGGSTRNGYCACGETGTCIDNSHKCNCDNNAVSRITFDDGYLTDKTKLPLRHIKIGDMGDANEKAWYAIGKVECFGQV